VDTTCTCRLLATVTLCLWYFYIISFWRRCPGTCSLQHQHWLPYSRLGFYFSFLFLFFLSLSSSLFLLDTTYTRCSVFFVCTGEVKGIKTLPHLILRSKQLHDHEVKKQKARREHKSMQVLRDYALRQALGTTSSIGSLTI